MPRRRLLALGDPWLPNADSAAALLMNLAADQLARKRIRDAGGVEALAAMLRASPPEHVRERLDFCFTMLGGGALVVGREGEWRWGAAGGGAAGHCGMNGLRSCAVRAGR